MTRLTRSTALLPLVLCLASCTLGFDRKWQKAVAEAGHTPSTTLAGPWEGTWKSEASGHEGTLRAVATQTAPPTPHSSAFEFHYEATWMKFLRACMTAQHEVVGVNARAKQPAILRGEEDLGLLGGIYTFSGTASPTEFRAQYRSSADHGTFEMKRPAGRP
jgi:hypothetical protein